MALNLINMKNLLLLPMLFILLSCSDNQKNEDNRMTKLKSIGLSIELPTGYSVITENNVDSIKSIIIKVRKRSPYSENIIENIEKNKGWQAIIENCNPQNIIWFVRLPGKTTIEEKNVNPDQFNKI